MCVIVAIQQRVFSLHHSIKLSAGRLLSAIMEVESHSWSSVTSDGYNTMHMTSSNFQSDLSCRVRQLVLADDDEPISNHGDVATSEKMAQDEQQRLSTTPRVRGGNFPRRPTIGEGIAAPTSLISTGKVPHSVRTTHYNWTTAKPEHRKAPHSVRTIRFNWTTSKPEHRKACCT